MANVLIFVRLQGVGRTAELVSYLDVIGYDDVVHYDPGSGVELNPLPNATAQLQGQGALAAAPTTVVTPAAAMGATAGLQATLGRSTPVEATTAGTSSLVASLVVVTAGGVDPEPSLVAITAQLGAHASASATLLAVAVTSAALGAQAHLVADLQAVGTLGASLGAQAGLGAPLGAVVAVGAQLAAEAGLGAPLGAVPVLVAELAGQGQLAADLERLVVVHQLVATLAGTGGLEAGLRYGNRVGCAVVRDAVAQADASDGLECIPEQVPSSA